MANEQRKASQTSTGYTRTVEKAFEDSEYTGELDLSGHKLPELPDYAGSYELNSLISVDLSRNDLIEIPHELHMCWTLETLNCYHNSIRSLPNDIGQLQNLLLLNLSRNQLSVLPSSLCSLPCLQVLLLSCNKLESLPEEIYRLRRLMELDVSSNRLLQLPMQITELTSLRVLNLRLNKLVELPSGMSRMCLNVLNLSSNRITCLPAELYSMSSLHALDVDANPLTAPPPNICVKGLKHIMKYLTTERKRYSRQRSNSVDFRHDERSRPVDQLTDVVTRLDLNHNISPSQNTGVGPDVIPAGDIHRTQWSGGKHDSSVVNETSALNDSLISRDDQLSYDPDLDVIVPTDEDDEVVEEEKDDNVDNDKEDENYNEYKDANTGDDGYDDDDDKSYDDELEIETEIIQPRTSRQVSIDGVHSQNFGQLPDLFSQPHQPRPDSPLHPLVSEGWLTDSYVDKSVVSNVDTSDNVDDDFMAPLHYSVSLSDDSTMPDEDEVEFQLRRQDMLTVQRSEADRVRRRLEMEHDQQELNASQSADNTSVLHQLPSPFLTSADGSQGTAAEVEAASFASDIRDDDAGDEYDPYLTIRRNFQHANDGFTSVMWLRKLIRSQLNIEAPADLSSALRDGVILCHLANHIRPGAVPKLHVPSPTMESLPLTKTQQNVDNFLLACRTIGVHEADLCSPAAILDGSGLVDVAVTVRAMVACSIQLRQSSV